MRGKDADLSSGLIGKGITPAYAGKRHLYPRPRVSDQDHPRLCGEKLPAAWLVERSGGITPAYAGKRNRRERKLTLLEDHPRLCGEKERISSSSVP